jgi:hypothetical protein
MMKHCNFCGKNRPQVAMAQVCNNCAKGQLGDRWCDFCNKTTNTEIAWICSDCAAGRVGDAWCDFCNKTTATKPARACNNCSA